MSDGRAVREVLELSLFAGRSVDAKKRLYALIFGRFERELGITPRL